MNHGELEWEPHSNVHFVTGIYVCIYSTNKANFVHMISMFIPLKEKKAAILWFTFTV